MFALLFPHCYPFPMPGQDASPATRADLRALESRLGALELRVGKGFHAVHESIDQVLVVLENINDRLNAKLG